MARQPHFEAHFWVYIVTGGKIRFPALVESGDDVLNVSYSWRSFGKQVWQ
jgi:hypothetical protein